MVKSIVFASLVLCGCGGAAGSSDKVEAVVEPVESAEPAPVLDPLYDEECLARNASTMLAKPTITFCKTLGDETVATVTIQPGDDVIDPATCLIGYDGRGLIESLVELQFKKC